MRHKLAFCCALLTMGSATFAAEPTSATNVTPLLTKSLGGSDGQEATMFTVDTEKLS